MFGALNRFIARLDSDGPSPTSRDGHGAFGFQVLRNKNADIQLEPWYDFILGINGRQVVQETPFAERFEHALLMWLSGQSRFESVCNRDSELRRSQCGSDSVERQGTSF